MTYTSDRQRSKRWLKLATRFPMDDRWGRITDRALRAHAMLLFVCLICWAKEETANGEMLRCEADKRFLIEKVVRHALTPTELNRAWDALFAVGALIEDPSGAFHCLIAAYGRHQEGMHTSKQWLAMRRMLAEKERSGE